MVLRLHTFLAGCLALLLAALLALAPVGAKPASGGYQLLGAAASGHQADIPLAALGDFDYFAKIAPECCNAPNTGNLLWGSWNDYPKVTVGGREYAQIGDRVYTRHAVDRMQPSGLGTPAGADGPGRNVTPNMVEDVIAGGTQATATVNGTLRTSYTSGNVRV